MGETEMVIPPLDRLSPIRLKQAQPGPEHQSNETPMLLDVCGVAKRYKHTQALSNISLQVRRGEIFGLLGPDGSGKSSLIRAIAGVQQYDEGSITVFQQLVDSERSAEKVKGRIGLMPQGLGNNLYAELSIDENIDYFAGLRLMDSAELRQRKDQLLEITRLSKFRDRPMKKLSGGMKQKLGLVCTLIHQPEFVLLDEPTTGVDPVSRRDFWAIVSELVHESGMTAVVSTAYMDEAAYMDRLALLMDGKVVSQGREEELETLVAGSIVSFHCDRSLATADKIRAQFPQVQSMGNVVRVFVPDLDADAAAKSIRDIPDVSTGELTISAPNLEDVLTGLLRQDASTSEHAAGTTSPPSMLTANKQRPDKSGKAPIVANKLVRDFGTFRAVDHVSFEVAEGQIFGLLGSNGAGKTTVIKMLTGLLPASYGSGSVAGADMKRASHAIRERIGYMSQSFSLYLDMTAMENLEFYAGVYGLFPRQRRQRIPELLSMIGLESYEGRLTSDLPMGIRQRLALGCALVHRPRVIFLDEPTSGVDVLGRRQFWEILVRLAREDGVAILVTTHYMLEAEHCDNLALMYAGRVVASGSPSQLRHNLETNVGVSLGLETTSPLQSMRIAKQNGFKRAALFGRSLRVLTQNAELDQRRLRDLLAAENIDVIGAQHEPVTMEDVFVDLILSEEHASNNRENPSTESQP